MDQPPAMPRRVAWFAAWLKVALWLLFVGLLFGLCHGVLDSTNPNGLGTKDIVARVVVIVIVYFALIFSPTWAGGRFVLDSQPTAGWITLTTLWGAVIGFALVDVPARMNSYLDNEFLGLACTISSAGAMVGACLGAHWERSVAYSSRPRGGVLLGFSWLIITVIAYFVLGPAFQVARR